MSAVQDIGFNAFLNRARASVGRGAAPIASRTGCSWSSRPRQACALRPRSACARRSRAGSPSPWAITAGEFKTPFTREYLIPVPQLEMADLAVAVDSIAPKYDVGVMGEVVGRARTRTSMSAVFNGEGANAIANRDSVAIVVARADDAAAATARARAAATLTTAPTACAGAWTA
jgi:hypothetical protein